MGDRTKDEGRYFITHLSWDSICKLKGNGGVDFGEVQDFNQIMLSKLLAV